MSVFELSPEKQEALDAAELIRQALEGGTACFTCSFQAEDVVVLDHLRRREPRIPVLFLETGYHFAETLAYRDRLAERWNLRLVNLSADSTVAQQEARFGILNQTDPARCCQMRKVEPLIKGLAPYDVWFTGLRRQQSPTRANLRKIERHLLPDGKALWKVSPIADWIWEDVAGYLDAHDIEALPLYAQGYTSIGCEPCTSLPLDAANARSGRWGGRKLECGIHTFTVAPATDKL
jgi:phosphoadenosine phosphosulfate reductase